ncbi:MAG: hypothetical protein GF346_01855 [Candidatus Eisenbacteria bacterium]|nr:hypothetical protein [Candidatus Latescibacterota bacterium]MBD3301175.1 hypothetical protein [Candidatus Eisenbacteria bacterium]
MFRKFRELLGSENLLEAAYATTVTMLEFDAKMYAASCKVLRRTDGVDLPFDIRRTDRKINKYEREVRRNVLTHLAVTGTQNLVPGLVLVSIVIDVERIGDYTKNIVELASMHPKRLHGGTREADLSHIESWIEQLFPVVNSVLRTQDQTAARSIMSREPEIGSLSESIVADMILQRDPEVAPPQAVSLALYARYLKRINAHLTNIASAIVNPFHRIGFREKKQRKAKE